MVSDKEYRRIVRRVKFRRWFVDHHLWPRNKMEKLIDEFSRTTDVPRVLTKRDVLDAIEALRKRDNP